MLLKSDINALPHIRTIDRPLEETIEVVDRFINAGGKQVLIVTGDPPQNPSQLVYQISPIEVVAALRNTYPQLAIYCGLDPYRHSFQEEWQYAKKKVQAGANGFFTQPIFDLSLAKLYLDQFHDTQLFLGISPVLTETSLNYWITRNKAFFPKGFQTDLSYNCTLSKQIINLTQSAGQHNYLMPIKAPLIEYLAGVLD